MAERRYNKMSAKDKAIHEQQKLQRRKINKKKRAKILADFAKIMSLGVIGATLVIGAVSFALASDFSKSPELYEYSLKVSVDDKKTTLSKDISVKNNICYISLDALSDVLGCKMMGDVDIMSLVFDDGGKISFFIDTYLYSVGSLVRNLDAPSYFSGMDGDVYVPVEFIFDIFDGIELSGEKKGNRISYTLNISSDYSFAFSGNMPEQSIDAGSVKLTTPPGSNFIADLSEYEMYMDPENADEYVRLINTEYPLGENYIPEDLISISYTRKDRAAAQMREYAAKALDAMFIEMRANGFTDVSVTSAYRSYDYQKQLFDNSIKNLSAYYDYDTAYAKTATMYAVPGSSEHQSGFCADLHNLPSASQAFEAEAAYKWLLTHCADFGFILRYPKEKQDITGIMFEPWHYRFVGRYHAQKIMQSGLCLEEYCIQNGIGLE